MKNPKECCCIRQNQTFFILNELTRPECKDRSEPLLFHHDSFSRFIFVIINEEREAVTANVPVSAIPGIIEKIKNLNLISMMPLAPLESETPKSPGYTTIITSGILKGKTPVAALLEDAEKNQQLLINQKKWLEQNIPRYPKNKIQIEAIEDALKLFKEGRISSDISMSGCKTEEVYNTGMRPLIRRKEKDGKHFVYEISIKWHGGMKKPVEIDIRNYYAPVIKTDTGLLNVLAKDRQNELHNSFSMTIDEWMWVAHMLETNISTFEYIHAGEFYRLANEDALKNREEVKKTDNKMAS